MKISITFLNHASMILDLPGGISILMDPWFEGTCFKDGWGLVYDNPQAYERALHCTHLWLSHFHGDHAHPATLKQLRAMNPGIRCLANEAANFSLPGALRKLGFQNIVPLREREPMRLADAVTITRYPTAGIDNMLLVEAGGLTILNFNDCAIPVSAMRALRGRFGRIDLLLNNFNVANKIVAFPAEDPAATRARNLREFKTALDALDPVRVIPFASMHYFRAEETRAQNETLLTSEDIARVDPRVLALPIGSKVELEAGCEPRICAVCPGVGRAGQSVLQRGASRAPAELVAEASRFGRDLRLHFFGLLIMMPTLRIRVKDLGQTLRLSFRGRCRLEPSRGDESIEAHSEALYAWFRDAYGTDSFLVAGHFAILNGRDLGRLRALFLLALLKENVLSFLGIVRLLKDRAGWLFFWNRREEIAATLSGVRFLVGRRL